MLLGLFITFSAIIGIFNFKFALNRMHSAAMNDTMAALCVIISLIILSGINASSIKFILIIFFLWITTPIASHLVAKLEVMTDNELLHHVKTKDMRKENKDK